MVQNRIKEIRKKKGLTQVELAQILGVSQTAIYKLETGASDLDTKWMECISEALNVKPCELLPLEWQPQVLTEEEQEILALFRKKNRVTNSNIPSEETKRNYKSVKSSERL